MRRILLAIPFAVALWSCFQEPEHSTQLVFALDPSLVGDFDSVRVEIAGPQASVSFTVVLQPGQTEIRVEKPAIGPDFLVVVTGFSSDTVVYQKLFQYSGGRLDSARQSVNLLDAVLSLYDTLPSLFPGNTGNGFTLTSSDSAIANVVNGRIVAAGLGNARVAISSSSGLDDTVRITVREPAYLSEIRPITQSWCGACHHVQAPIYLLDSVALVALGSEAIYRLSLPPTDPDHMPADTVRRVLPPRDLNMLLYWLQQNAIRVTGISANNMAVALGDSVLPAIQWTPANANNRNYTLVSSDTSNVSVSGGALLANDTGWSNVTATSQDGGFTATFRVTVGWPDFATRVRPITASKCIPCHVPGTNWNFQDSAVLLEHGTEAIVRVQLPVGDVRHMPLDTALVLAPRELKTLVGWLRAFIVPLDSVRVANLSVRVGDTAAPSVTWYPSNASNKRYTLILTDTTYVRNVGGRLFGKALGGPPTLVILTTNEGLMQRNFQATVTPVPVDSIRAVDTGGALYENVRPRVQVFPANATYPAWSVRNLSPTSWVSIIQPDTVQGLLMGVIAKIEVFNVYDPSVADTIDFGVALRVTALRALDQTVLKDSIFAPALTWSPSSAMDQTYRLQSLDSGVVYVYDTSTTPRLYASALGRANVIVTSNDGGFADTFTVTVDSMVRAVSVSFSPPIPALVFADSFYFPSLAWNPANTTNRTFILSTTTPAVIGLPTTTSFHGITLGPGNLTATSADGPQAVANFTVVRPPFSKVSGIVATYCAGCHYPGSGRIFLSDSSTGIASKADIVNRLQVGQMPPGGMVNPDLSTMIRYFNW